MLYIKIIYKGHFNLSYSFSEHLTTKVIIRKDNFLLSEILDCGKRQICIKGSVKEPSCIFNV